jgi:hypothetical protein
MQVYNIPQTWEICIKYYVLPLRVEVHIASDFSVIEGR